MDSTRTHPSIQLHHLHHHPYDPDPTPDPNHPVQHRLMTLLRSLNHPRSLLRLLGSISISITLILLTLNHPSNSTPSPSPSHERFIFTSEQSLQVDLSSNPNQSALSLDPSANPPAQNNSTLDLEPAEIENRILNAAPILGYYNQSRGELSDWMSSVPDKIPITRMNIPGTHDSATWNYTKETQDSLESVTGKLPPSIAFRCQDRSLFQMLADGIRFFDLRVGFLPDREQLGFYHASALLSLTATLPDVLLGLYTWLDDHPSETILISIKVDNATFEDPPSSKQPSTLKLQEIIYQLLTQSELARTHWLQEDRQLGTLGAARGKLIFIQRIEWDYIRTNGELKPIGIPLPPSRFNENDGNFTITYSSSPGGGANRVRKAYIEDFYNLLPNPTSVEKKVQMKFDAIQSHLALAAAESTPVEQVESADGLFLTFTSGGALKNIPPVTPKMLAIGTGRGRSVRDAVNGKVLSLLQDRYTNPQPAPVRLGILIFDWYHQVPDLVPLLIRLNPTRSSD